MVETYRIKITQDAIAVLLTSDGTEVRFKDEPIEALKDILGLVDFAPNSMVSQRLLECKGQSFDLPNSYTAEVQIVPVPCPGHNFGEGVACLVNHMDRRAVLIPLKQEPTEIEKVFQHIPKGKFDQHYEGEPGNEAKKEDDISCPFCNEKGFDKIGLKDHLNNNCKEFETTTVLP